MKINKLKGFLIASCYIIIALFSYPQCMDSNISAIEDNRLRVNMSNIEGFQQDNLILHISRCNAVANAMNYDIRITNLENSSQVLIVPAERTANFSGAWFPWCSTPNIEEIKGKAFKVDKNNDEVLFYIYQDYQTSTIYSYNEIDNSFIKCADDAYGYTDMIIMNRSSHSGKLLPWCSKS